MNNLARNIRAARKERYLPPNPMNLQAIPILPNNYRVSSTGDQFFAYDSGVGDPNRIMIFVLPQGIHDNGRIFPCAFALLPNKTQATCDSFFMELYRMIQ